MLPLPNQANMSSSSQQLSLNTTTSHARKCAPTRKIITSNFACGPAQPRMCKQFTRCVVCARFARMQDLARLSCIPADRPLVDCLRCDVWFTSHVRRRRRRSSYHRQTLRGFLPSGAVCVRWRMLGLERFKVLTFLLRTSKLVYQIGLLEEFDVIWCWWCSSGKYN